MTNFQLQLFPNTNEELISILKEFVNEIEAYEAEGKLAESKEECKFHRKQLIETLKFHEF